MIEIKITKGTLTRIVNAEIPIKAFKNENFLGVSVTI
jgi:hypothetical protein